MLKKILVLFIIATSTQSCFAKQYQESLARVNYAKTKKVSLNNKFLIVNKNNKYGVITNKNRVKIPFIYDEIRPFEYGLFIIKINDRYGVINTSNKILICPIYKTINLVKF